MRPKRILLKIRSREISFVDNLLLSCQIVLKFCIEVVSVPRSMHIFKKDLTTEIDNQDFAKFEF